MGAWLTWWALLLPIGAIATPLVALLLPRFTAMGYAFAKPLGVLLLGYVYWIGVTAGALPNSRAGVVAALAVLAIVSAAAGVWRRRELRDGLRGGLPFVLGVEALFLAMFALATFLRSYVPEIANTEKPMEIGFLNAVLRAERFPPGDPWFAGEPISYYYFGYMLLAAVTKLAGTAAATAFNLGLALTAALSAVAIFGLGYELVARSLTKRRASLRVDVRPWAFGLGAVGFALVLGNLEAVLEVFASHGWMGHDALRRAFDIEGLDAVEHSDRWYPDGYWWWWRATRVVPGTITEFPFFSFLLGDLHPHVMAIPFRFLLLAVAASLLLSPAGADGWARRDWPALLILALVLGSFGFLSTWDLPAMAAFLFAAALLVRLRAGAALPRALTAAAVFAGAPLAFGIAAYLPFWTSIDNPGWGPEVVLGATTRPDHALLLWAPLGSVVLTFVGVALWRGDRATLRRPRVFAGAAAIAAAPVVVWAAWVTAQFGAGALTDELGDRGVGWITGAALAIALVATVVALAQRARPAATAVESDERAATFALLTAFMGLLLIYGVEFFYIDDILHARLNSVFKLYFQAWLLLAAAAGFGAWYVLQPLPGARAVLWPLRSAIALVLAGGLVYAVTATFARTDDFAGTRTLDGLAWVRDAQPAEYRAQMWLREHSEQDDVVLEAFGDAYTDAGRVSARTGTTALLGWRIHEVNWRGDKPAYAERAEVIDRIYRSAEASQARELLRRHNVRWVYVGDLEMQRYAGAGLTKFGAFMDVAYDDGGVRIYRMRDDGE